MDMMSGESYIPKEFRECSPSPLNSDVEQMEVAAEISKMDKFESDMGLAQADIEETDILWSDSDGELENDAQAETFEDIGKVDMMNFAVDLHNKQEMNDDLQFQRKLFEKRSDLTTYASEKIGDYPMLISDSKIREAFKKMKKYDKILREKILLERQVKQNTVRLEQQIIQELTALTGQRPQTREVTDNIRQFLALTLPESRENSENCILEDFSRSSFSPIFKTQLDDSFSNVKENDYESEIVNTNENDYESEIVNTNENSSKGHQSSFHISEPSIDQPCKTHFIRRNILLAADGGGSTAMTDDEKLRLKELLNEADDLSLDDENCKVMNVFCKNGFSPPLHDQDRLSEIDSQIEELALPSLVSIPGNVSSHSLKSQSIGNWLTSVQCDVKSRKEARKKLSMIDGKLEQFHKSQSKLTADEIDAVVASCSNFGNTSDGNDPPRPSENFQLAPEMLQQLLQDTKLERELTNETTMAYSSPEEEHYLLSSEGHELEEGEEELSSGGSSIELDSSLEEREIAADRVSPNNRRPRSCFLPQICDEGILKSQASAQLTYMRRCKSTDNDLNCRLSNLFII